MHDGVNYYTFAYTIDKMPGNGQGGGTLLIIHGGAFEIETREIFSLSSLSKDMALGERE
jgi:hypothetical protein